MGMDTGDSTKLCAWRTVPDATLAHCLSDIESRLSSSDRRDSAWQHISDGIDSQESTADWTVRVKEAVADARNLARWCLSGRKEERPTVQQIMDHRFFEPIAAAPHELPMQYYAFISHAQADASGVAAALYFMHERLGLYCWLDVQQWTPMMKYQRGIQ